MRVRFFFIAFFIVALYAKAQHKIGIPFIQNYSPEKYNAYIQNWAIAQDSSGLMYFGNTKGLLTFDGNIWQIYTLPNQSAAFSIAIGNQEQIYIGGAGEVAKLISDSMNNKVCISLIEKLPEKERVFDNINQSFYSEKYNTVFFNARTKVLAYSEEKNSFSVFKPTDKFQRMFLSDADVLIAENKKGLWRFTGESFEEIEGNEYIYDDFIYGIVNYDANRKLIVTKKNGFLLYYPNGTIINGKQEHFKKLDFAAEPHLKEAGIHYIANIKNQKVAIGTKKSGIYILDMQGNIIYHIDKAIGLQNNYVRYLYSDKTNNIWVAMNEGIDYMIPNSPVSKYSIKNGLEGVALSSIIHNDVLYVTTTEAVYFCEDGRVFKRFESLKGETFMLEIIDDELYIGNRYGVYMVQGKSLVKICNDYLYNLKKLPYEGRNFYVAGDGNGFMVFEKNGKFFKKISTIKNFNFYSKYLEIDSKGQIWVSHTNEGVFKCTLNSSLDSCSIKHYTDINGLPSKLDNRVYKIRLEDKDSLVFTTKKGMYTYQEKSNSFEPIDLFKETIGNENKISRIAQDELGNLIFNQGEQYNILYDISGGNYFIDKLLLLKLRGKSVENIRAVNHELFLFTGQDGLFIFNKTDSEEPSCKFSTHIGKIEVNDTITLTHYEGNEVPSFSNHKNSFVFHFSSFYFEEHERTQYSYILEGYDSPVNGWSKWTTETKNKYTNIPPGEYTFKVKAKNIYNQIGEEASFTFVVIPPWYKRWWAITLLIFILIYLVVIYVRARIKRVKKVNKRFEKIIKDRTSEIREKNEILEDQQMELIQQKEEIIAQKEMLEKQNAEIIEKNKELEYLSLVASKTENSVIITDKKGDFEWANEGFNRMFEQSLNDFIRKYGNNLFLTSSSNKKRETMDRIFNDKKAVTYDSHIIKSDGEKIWLQTTVTPILDEKNEIKKLIAIDIDISEVKRAEENAKKHYRKIEKQNQLITESIIYAHKIQEAILPTKKSYKGIFDSFILYKPKENVSGDFYYFVNFPEDNESFIAVADCTGHGIEGAFMTIIGNDLLKELVLYRNMREPHEILQELDKEVTAIFDNDFSIQIESINIILCKIKWKDDGTRDVTYCGASRPLIYYSNDSKTIDVDKGWCKNIGEITTLKEPFVYTDKKIVLKKNDIIYLTTDGYSNQNDLKQKKYGSRKLFKKLELIAHLDLEEQHKILEDDINLYMSDTKQYDDITIWGIKL